MKDLFKSTKFYIVLAILIGACLRLYGLSIQGLWFDETVSAVTALSHTYKEFMQHFFMDFHPPLYPVFLCFWVKIFGNTETALRLPSAIAGILTLFPMYFLSKKVFNKYIATSATVLTAFSSLALAYSQEARDYSFVLLFSTLSTLFWLNIVKNKSNISWKELGFYGLACTATIYTHYFGVLLVLCQFVYLFFIMFSLKDDQFTRKMVILSFTMIFLFIPELYLFTYSSRGLPDTAQWLQKPTFDSFIQLIDFIFNKKLIILLLLPALLRIKNLTKPDPLLLSLLYMLITPVTIVFLVSKYSTFTCFFPRYLIIIVPVAYLLMSVLLSKSLSGIKANIFVFIVSFVSLLLFLFVPGNNIWSDQYTYYGPYKQQWREAQKYISENYEPDSVIFVDRTPVYFSYYFDRFNKTSIKYNISEYMCPTALVGEIMNLKIGKKSGRAFIVSDFVEIPQKVMASIRAQHVKYIVKSYNGVYVYDFKLN